jgi:hypothetical protein
MSKKSSAPSAIPGLPGLRGISIQVSGPALGGPGGLPAGMPAGLAQALAQALANGGLPFGPAMGPGGKPLSEAEQKAQEQKHMQVGETFNELRRLMRSRAPSAAALEEATRIWGALTPKTQGVDVVRGKPEGIAWTAGARLAVDAVEASVAFKSGLGWMRWADERGANWLAQPGVDNLPPAAVIALRDPAVRPRFAGNCERAAEWLIAREPGSADHLVSAMSSPSGQLLSIFELAGRVAARHYGKEGLEFDPLAWKATLASAAALQKSSSSPTLGEQATLDAALSLLQIWSPADEASKGAAAREFAEMSLDALFACADPAAFARLWAEMCQGRMPLSPMGRAMVDRLAHRGLDLTARLTSGEKAGCAPLFALNEILRQNTDTIREDCREVVEGLMEALVSAGAPAESILPDVDPVAFAGSARAKALIRAAIERKALSQETAAASHKGEEERAPEIEAPHHAARAQRL